MNEERNQEMLNLLADRAVFGLNEAESVELEKLLREFPALKDDDSFEIAAAAFNLVSLEANESLPNHLNSRILADADRYFAAGETEPETYQKTFAFAPQKRSLWNSLGWAAAVLACIILALNLWTTRVKAPDAATVNPTPTVAPLPSPAALNPARQREQLLASANDVVQKNWTEFNPKKPRGITGDVVWSNSAQKGFVRFRNLPVNDKNKETYQVWIFDEKQNLKTPISGGVFDIDETGEVIIPLDSQIKVRKPVQFAVTAEKPGGVVVSKLGKVMAVAKIET